MNDNDMSNDNVTQTEQDALDLAEFGITRSEWAEERAAWTDTCEELPQEMPFPELHSCALPPAFWTDLAAETGSEVPF